LVLVLLLAGCLTAPPAAHEPEGIGPAALAPLTTAAFHAGAFLSFSIPSYDGTPIHVDVRLPNGSGPFPVIVDYTPYSSLGQNEEGAAAQVSGPAPGGSPLSSLLADQYTSYGYAVAVADVRGTVESGGCLEVGGPDEGRDGYALVEALSAMPWSNHKVALAGTSWDGTTPLETAELRPPHLAAIVAMSPVTDWYKYYFELGTHRRDGDPFPGSSDTDPVFDAFLGGLPGPRTATVAPTKATCIATFTEEDDAQDNLDAFWTERNIAAHAANITTPVLYGMGWEDENVGTAMIPGFWANLTAPKFAWLEQHGHGVPGSKTGFYAFMHRFLDFYLFGRPNGATLAPAVVVEDNLHGFRAETTWPPQDTRVELLNFSAGGALATAPASEGTATFHDDGTGMENTPSGTDQLTFVTTAWPAGLHIAGTPEIHLSMATDMPDTQVDVKVYDVASNGSATFLTRGYLDFKHRENLTHADPVVSGTTYAFTFALHPEDWRIAPGHALRVVIKGSDDYVVRSPYRATDTFSLGGSKAWLALPIVSDAHRVYGASPPNPWNASADV
jgi:predicted acyl esterase